MASDEYFRSGTAAKLDAALSATGMWRAGDAGVSPAAMSPRSVHNSWQANEDGVPTGFAALDAAFLHRGWPRAGLAELLCDTCGIGELRLLTPALATLCRDEARSIVLVKPPFVPYPPALRNVGMDVAKILSIRPRNWREELWAMEQALHSGACSAVLGWPSEASLGFATLRRLLLAARQGRTWGSLFRPAQAAASASPAELRLRLLPCPATDRRRADRLRVDIVKRRGGWPLPGIKVVVPDGKQST